MKSNHLAPHVPYMLNSSDAHYKAVPLNSDRVKVFFVYVTLINVKTKCNINVILVNNIRETIIIGIFRDDFCEKDYGKLSSDILRNVKFTLF